MHRYQQKQRLAVIFALSVLLLFSLPVLASCIDDKTCRLIQRDTFESTHWTEQCDSLFRGKNVICGGKDAVVFMTPKKPGYVLDGFAKRVINFYMHPLGEQATHNPSLIDVTSMLNNVVYDPSSEGAIFGMDYSELHSFSLGAGGARFILEQDGQRFWTAVNIDVTLPAGTNALAINRCLVATDFFNETGTPGHPDFSASGPPIHFGFRRRNANHAETSGFVTRETLDEFRIVVYKTTNGGCQNGPAQLRIGNTNQGAYWSHENPDIQYQITVENLAGADATGTVVTETIPANTTWIPDPAWTCLPDGNAGSTCTRPVPDLPEGSSVTYDFGVRVDSATPVYEEIFNEASVNPSSGVLTFHENLSTDQNLICCFAAVLGGQGEQYCPGRFLSMLKGISGTLSVSPGAILDYDINIKIAEYYDRPDPVAEDVLITDVVDPNTTLICNENSPFTHDGSVVSCNSTTGKFVVDLGRLTADVIDDYRVEATVKVKDQLSGEVTQVCNQAVATGSNIHRTLSGDPRALQQPNHDMSCKAVDDASSKILSSVEQQNISDPAPKIENLDLTLFYRLRDRVLNQTPGGRAVIDRFYEFLGPVAATTAASPDAAIRALAFALGWQPLFNTLIDGRGNEAVIGTEHTDLLQTYIDALKISATSTELLDAIERDEALLNIPGWVGMNMNEWLVDLGSIETFRAQAPKKVRATDGDFAHRVEVTWEAVDGANVYRIFRCLTKGQTCGSPVGYSKTTGFKDIIGETDVVYFYRVKACENNHCSRFSAANSGFKATRLARPVGIRASAGTFQDRVEVSWNPVIDALVYRVFRCLTDGQTCGKPIGFPTGTTFSDTRGEPGKVYFYRIRACKKSQCGKFSVASRGFKAVAE